MGLGRGISKVSKRQCEQKETGFCAAGLLSALAASCRLCQGLYPWARPSEVTPVGTRPMFQKYPA